MKSRDELKRILQEEIKCYCRLNDLLKEEKDAIISFKPAQLEEVAKKKDTLALQIRLLDEERKRLVDELASHYGTGRSLTEIYNATGDDDFLRIRSELVSVLQSIEELNEINRIFIERATFHLKTSASFLQSVTARADVKNRVMREV
ncbi:MAG: flagellar protein FlgN [Nitrospirae bacterium]|nr:MAG: flagellar protein FlgN [Nitrospirota bacterium]